MSKRTLTEAEQSVVKKAVNAIFAAVASKKMAALEKKMMKDPEFRASIDRLTQIRDRLEKHFEKHFYNDPEYIKLKKREAR